jgi:hypothetical protein
MTTFEEWLEILELIRDRVPLERWREHRREQLLRILECQLDPEADDEFIRELGTWQVYLRHVVGLPQISDSNLTRDVEA